MTELGPDLGAAPFVLRSDRLAVEVAYPGSAYQGTRFDWTGFVRQVTLDGRHTYCVPESTVPGQGTGGVGLCNEFGIDRPIGYEDAAPGDLFPKLGIGLLVRPDEAPYSFMRPYEIAHRFPLHVDAREDGVTFTLQPVPCRGYAARLTKVLSVEGNALAIAYALENVGEQPVSTHEYCHNFVGINGHPIGPAYRLAFPQPVRFADLPPVPARYLPPFLRIVSRVLPGLPGWIARRRMLGSFQVDGRTLRLRATPQRPFYARLSGLAQTDAPQWDLLHAPSGVGMCERVDLAPARLALWGAAHVISAEVFVDLDVKPGETRRWTRRYVFYSL